MSWNRCGTPRVCPSVRPTCVVYNVTPGSPVSTSSPPRPGRPRPSLRPRCGGVPPTTGTFCNRRAPVLGAPVRHKSLRAAQPQPGPAEPGPAPPGWLPALCLCSLPAPIHTCSELLTEVHPSVSSTRKLARQSLIDFLARLASTDSCAAHSLQLGQRGLHSSKLIADDDEDLDLARAHPGICVRGAVPSLSRPLPVLF